MSYKDTDRYKKWQRALPDRLDAIFEKGCPLSGDDAEHAEFRALVVEAYRAYAAVMATPMDDDDWADETAEWPKGAVAK